MEKMFTLTELRQEKHLSQKELAIKLKISPSSICMYEKGERIPPLNKAIQISEFFEIPVENILFKSKVEKQMV